jgi:calcium-dependent protein kinase
MGICQSSESTTTAGGTSRFTQKQTLATECCCEDDSSNHKNLTEHMAKQRITDGHLHSNVVNIEDVSGRKIDQVYDGVVHGKVLGRGVAGVVRLVTHKTTGIHYAVKCLDKSGIGDSQEQQQQLGEEILIMSQLDHPNICRLHEVYEDETQIYLVQELGEGGDLFDLLDEQPNYHYQEQDAVKLVHQMLSALRYLHAKGIIHRDLKLENFLYSTQKHQQLKLIDFGLSKHYVPGDVQHDIVGTPYTCSPEVIAGNYDSKCDMWAIGVLSFMLLCGETPFGGCGGPESILELRNNIIAAKYQFEPVNTWKNVSPEAKDFVSKLLVVDPKARPSAIETQQHPWIRAYLEASIKDATVSPKIVKSLVTFKNLSLTNRLMLEVLSFTLLPEQLSDIRVEFEKMDSDGLGEISLDCMLQVLTRSSEGQEGLSETEIKDIFETMKVGKAEPNVHWHEFVAACLPECHVDERNIRVAFDRLDLDHNGFITFDEIIQLIARDANENEDVLRQAWADSVTEYHCQMSRFNLDDFSHLVHGSLS